MNIHESFPGCELTDDQSQLVSLLREFLKDNQRCFVLKGYAGTGKTFMMQGVTRYLREAQIPFCLLAPTGRAAKVIGQKTSCPASTIHKAIYMMDDLKEYKVKNEDGSETYKFYFDLANNDDDARTVYIVDEASMVSNVYSEAEFFRFGSGHLLNDFIKYVNLDNNDHRKKILFIGDDAQLPPVGSRNSPALDIKALNERLGFEPKSYELTQVVRQSEASGVLANATAIRDRIREGVYNVLDIDTSYRDVSSVGFDELLQEYLSACRSSSSEDAIIVAYSNSQVKDYNDMVRNHRFPRQPNVCAGDRVLVVQNNYRHEIPLLNGEFGEVMEVGDSTETRTVPLNKPQAGKKAIVSIKLCFRDVVVRFPGPDGGEYDIRCKIHDGLLSSKERDLSSDERKALYIDFKQRNPKLKAETPEFKEAIKSDPYFNCLQLKYGYAVTCHKAQGGEWMHVFVDFGATMGYFNEYYFRWAYTAVTRAQSHLYGLNTPHFGMLTPQVAVVADSDGTLDNVITVACCELERDVDFDMPNAQPFLKGLFITIMDSVCGDGVQVDDLTHHQYCEHYAFSHAGRQAVALVYYRANGTISHIDWKPGGDADLQDSLSQTMASLQGKRIVVECPLVEPPVPLEVEIPEECGYLKEFFETLETRAKEKGIAIIRVEHPTLYLGRYTFSRAGLTAAVDYTFRGNGRLSRVSPVAKHTTSRELLDEMLALSTRIGD
jgi:hypothetical protein